MEDPGCRAVIYKPAGVWSLPLPIGMFRQAAGANESLAVRRPGREGMMNLELRQQFTRCPCAASPPSALPAGPPPPRLPGSACRLHRSAAA